MDKETIENWNKSLDEAGYVSLIPIEEYFSSDLTEASIMIDFWIRQGIIVKKGERMSKLESPNQGRNWNVDVHERPVIQKTNFEKVKEFHKVFARTEDPETPTIPCETSIKLRVDLMEEELHEICKELVEETSYDIGKYSDIQVKKNIDVSKVAKELADLLYVVYGTGAVFGIDMDKVFAEVHRSNMSKLGEDGKPIRREDGKVLKGPNYFEPDIKKILVEQTAKELGEAAWLI